MIVQRLHSLLCLCAIKKSLMISVVTVIETGTETAVFLLNRTEPKPRFYASVLTVRF